MQWAHQVTRLDEVSMQLLLTERRLPERIPRWTVEALQFRKWLTSCMQCGDAGA